MRQAHFLARVWAAAIALIFADAVRAAAIDPVYVVTDLGEEGNGARFRIGEDCVLITAYHIIKDTTAPIVTPVRSVQARARVVKSNALLDVGLAVQTGATQPSCAPLPSDASIQQAILDVNREVWYVTANGDVRPFRVDLVEATDTVLKLQIRVDGINPQAPRAFIPGMSGALVVFGNVPVAILQSTLTAVPIVEARRLDFITRQFVDVLGRREVAAPVAPARSPRDADQLPKEYREIVLQARRNKARAERAEKSADVIQRDANDASSIAKQYPKDQVIKGYANFDADNGNFYSGQVYQVGIRFGSQGYGLSVVGPGDNAGNRYFCRYNRDVGCEGFGVIEFAANKANTNDLASWHGGMARGDRSGFGHLKWQPSDSKESWYYHAAEKPLPGVWDMSDGRRYEGEIGNSWDGMGVLWDKDGKLIRYGQWKNGAAVP